MSFYGWFRDRGALSEAELPEKLGNRYLEDLGDRSPELTIGRSLVKEGTRWYSTIR